MPKNNLEHTVRGNVLDGHKRDISAWALRKLQYFLAATVRMTSLRGQSARNP